MPKAQGFTRHVIYQLKQMYRQQADLYIKTTSSMNASTGVVTSVETKHPIRLAVVLPGDVAKNFAYDLSYIAANKNFTYGGFFDTSSRMLLIDKRDLPVLYKPNLTDRFIVEHRRYQIEKFTEYNEGHGVMFHVTELLNQPVNEITDAVDYLTFTEEAEATL